MNSEEQLIEKLNAVIQQVPDSPELWTLLAGTLSKTSRLGEAEAAFERALELDPLHVSAHMGKGALFSDRGETQPAIACFQRAIELDPDNEIARDALVELRRDGRVS